MSTTTKCPRRRGNGPGTGQHRVEVLTVAKATCSIDSCDRHVHGRGWCHMHYVRWRSHGDPLWQRPTPVALFWAKVDRHGPDGFHSQTGENLGPCWLWTAGVDWDGYGIVKIAGRSHRAHRWAYENFIGPIGPGLVPDHLCRVPACVNYEHHLELVTSRMNTLRGEGLAAANARRSVCVHGHPFIQRGRQRFCPECQRRNHRRWLGWPDDRLDEPNHKRQELRTHCPQGHPYDEANTWRDKTGGRHCRSCHRERERDRARAKGA